MTTKMVFLKSKKLIRIALLFTMILSFSPVFAHKNGNVDDKPEKINIQVNYLNRFPFSYANDKGVLKGIEIEILESFANWARKTQNLDIAFNFVAQNNFNELYQSMDKDSGQVIGAGTITIKKERLKDFNFTAPYLRNVSVLISSGNKTTLSSLDLLDTVFAGCHGIATENSVHYKHLESIKRGFYNDMPISLVKNQEEIPALVNNSNYFGYVDLLQFWKYKTENPESYIKVHRIADRNEEHFGFALPKGNTQLAILFDAFFNDGFGFTATKEYHKILEAYLGEEVVPTVEINFAGY